MKKLAAAFAVSLLSTGAAQAAGNLLIDGNFDAFAGQVTLGSYTKIDAGALGAWTVTGVSVDLILGAYNAISGVSIDLAGSPGPGGLTQSFNATAGYTYTLTFDYANNGGTELNVGLGTSTHQITNLAPNSASYSWTANATGTQWVSFNSGTAGGNSGPVIDNVMLTAVPEPETYALLLAGLGVIGMLSSRRRHGA